MPSLVSQARLGAQKAPPDLPPGLTQYSGAPQTEWDLNALDTKEKVLAAVRSLRYRGGNTFTGLPARPHPRVHSGLGPEAPLCPGVRPSHPPQIWKLRL